MKKIFYGVIAAAALTACDPATDDISWNGETMSAEVLSQGIKLEQFNMDAEGNLTPATDGNYIKFETNPSKVVEIYYLLADGSESSLSVAKANGMFLLAPSRGSDPTQTVYFRTKEFDGSSVTVTKQVTVQVATELSPEMILLCSNKGEKTWKWDFTQLGTCWGNLGADASWGGNDIPGGGFKWWGVEDAAELEGQKNHAVDGDFKPGEANNDAYMVFSETGIVKCYDANGNEIRKGSFEIQNWDPTFEADAWKMGTLHTSEGATLFPYEINAGGKFVTDFEIHALNAEKMLLVYPDGGAWSSWQEATYWTFSSNSDAEGILAGDWTWDFDQLGTCWGNMGADASWGGNDIPGGGFKWWGVEDAAELAGQANHVAGDPVPGEFSNDATMTFDVNGNVECFDADGKSIRKGTYEVQNWDATFTADAWKAGTLHTSEGATLFPYEINAGGKFVTDFEIHALNSEKMLLVYPDGGAWSGWQEATYWTFKKK